MRVPSITAIAETGDIQMTRSQSVGHSMRASQYNDKTDDIRYMLSQPLLTDSGLEIKPLSESRRRSSGTLSRPDIFYQVRNTFEKIYTFGARHTKSYSLKMKLRSLKHMGNRILIIDC